MQFVMNFQATAGAPYAILKRVRESRAYINGVPGAVDGLRCDILCYGNGFEPVSVKMPINTVLPITQEEIDRRNAAGDFVLCTFEGFTAKIYENYRDHTVAISATATDIHILTAAPGKEAK